MMHEPVSSNQERQIVTRELRDTVINDWLDRFEQRWEPSGEQLLRIAVEGGFLASPLALAELIRVDIDRRYQAGYAVDLGKYFSQYPELQRGQAAMGIAFEDFRARRSRGLACHRNRWAQIPDIHTQPWFRELVESPPPAISVTHKVEPEPGKTFGDFSIVCLLGTGAFSRVYLATQTTLAARYVALKVTRRMLEESLHLAQLQHTGIVPLHSVHRIGEYTILCMPYCGSATLADWLEATLPLGERLTRDTKTSGSLRDGQSLIDTIESKQAMLQRDTSVVSRATTNGTQLEKSNASEGPGQPEHIPLENASTRALLTRLSQLTGQGLVAWLGVRLSSALAYAHARGIIHGDLKPANILLRSDGEPALIDFNLSRCGTASECAYVGGTLRYMAPEQLQALLGRKVTLSFPADVYALGVVLYEVLAGHTPCTPPATMAECDLLAAIEERKSVPILWTDHGLRKSTTPGLRAILSKCLAYTAEDRYVDAQQLSEDLVAESQHRPLLHAHEPWVGRVSKLPRRYPRAFSTSVVTSACILLCVSIAWLGIGAWYRAEKLAADREADLYVNQLQASIVQVLDLGPRAPLPDVLQRTVDDRALTQSERWRGLSPDRRKQVDQAEYDFCLTAAVLLLEKSLPVNRKATDSTLRLLAFCEQRARELGGSQFASKLLASSSQGPRMRPTNLAPFPVQRWSMTPPPDAHGVTPAEYLLRARMALTIGQSSSALEQLRMLEVVDQQRLLYWLTTGAAELQLGEPQSASLSFTRAIDCAPYCSEAYQQRAQAYSALSKWQLAKADCDSAIERLTTGSGQQPTLPAAPFVQRALIYERLEHYSEALSDISRALSCGEESTRLYFIRSRLHRKAGNATAANLDLQLAMNREPISTADWIARALARVDQEPESALADLQRTLQREPDSTSLLQNIAYIQSEHLGNLSDALTTLDQLLQLQPDHQEARGGRCVLLARLHETRRALEDMAYLKEHFSKLLPVTLYQMGCAHALLASLRPASRREAVRHLMQALVLGYGHDILSSDSDLDAIRDDSEFKKLVQLSQLLNAR